MDQQKSDITYLKAELINLKSRITRIENFLASFNKAIFSLGDFSDPDELFIEAVQIANLHDRISVSVLQRHLDIGYARSSRILDQLVKRELVSSPDGTAKPRKVYKDKIQAYLEKNQGGGLER